VTFKISVKDPGIGIARGKLKTIFQKFEQADLSTTRKYGGTGLGLPICKELVELMNGKIGVKSVKNESSIFWFKINLAIPENQNSVVANKSIKPRRKKNSSLKNVNILLVEDNCISQKLMTYILEKYGCSITPASDGIEAIEQTRKQKFDIILMDCQMPKMDGYQATQEIRKLERKNKANPNIIIAITANALNGDKKRCLDAGMDDYLSKPITPKSLEAILEKWLKKTKTTRH
jgi:two-component system CheB/CheR fusion protein